jgi:hypothetical protein
MASRKTKHFERGLPHSDVLTRSMPGSHHGGKRKGLSMIYYNTAGPSGFGQYTTALSPNPWCGGTAHDRNMRFQTQCTIMTWYYLEKMEALNATARVQAEYWNILVERGLCIQ